MVRSGLHRSHTFFCTAYSCTFANQVNHYGESFSFSPFMAERIDAASITGFRGSFVQLQNSFRGRETLLAAC